jgi:predicted RNA methylase
VKKSIREKLSRVRSHYQIFGFWDTLRYSLSHLLVRTRDEEFDLKYGTNTTASLSMRYDEQPKPGQIVRSLPTHPKVLRYILRNLRIDYRDFTFIDFGCGKGRALLCAADFPFKRIIGVEWSKDLSDIALHNLTIYRSYRQKCTALEIHCMNVVDYKFPVSNIVLFMYNPFGLKITTQVFENVQRSALDFPHKFLVVYSGLGTYENTVIMECFNRFHIEVVRKCLTLNSQGSWILGEVRAGGLGKESGIR